MIKFEFINETTHEYTAFFPLKNALETFKQCLGTSVPNWFSKTKKPLPPFLSKAIMSFGFFCSLIMTPLFLIIDLGYSINNYLQEYYSLTDHQTQTIAMVLVATMTILFCITTVFLVSNKYLR